MLKNIMAVVVILGACICLAAEDYNKGQSKAESFNVVDGDSLGLNGERIRILNIDAPEYKQYCFDADGKKYMCGKRALRYMRELAKDKMVCKREDIDRYGRSLAKCHLPNGEDVGRLMVLAGWAVAYGDAYVEEEAAAKKNKKGIWQGKFMRPELYRALNKSRERLRK